MTKDEFNKRYDFLIKKRDEAKVELRGRKSWKTALGKEYWLQRTQMYDFRKKEIRELIDVANVMIEHYENIVKDYNDMIKEIWINVK